MKRKGTIVRLNEEMGLGIVSIKGENEEEHAYPFLFRDIKGYRGEYLKELKKIGFKENADVSVELDQDTISSVEITEAP